MRLYRKKTFHSGKRADLNNQYYRSRWESNWARYLNFLQKQGEILKWEYEPTEFWFHEIKRGTRSYKPDFSVYLKDGRLIYHEVKGWLDPVSATKLKRMAKYYPAVEIQVVDRKRYMAVAKTMKKIDLNWE